VELAYTDAGVRLSVTDIGGGAAPALTGVGSGYGLSAMRERAELLGGTVVAGAAGDGFRVEVTLPV
jgi:signal transduction histidine kinase